MSFPVGVVTVAVTGRPGPRPAVNVVVAPDAGTMLPMVAGAPSSRPSPGLVAELIDSDRGERRLAPGSSVDDDGSIRSESGAAPVTVSCCVPVTTPAADAMSVTVPAVASW